MRPRGAGSGRVGECALRGEVAVHLSGLGVNQDLDGFLSNLEYTSAHDGTGKDRLVGQQPSQPRHSRVRVLCGAGFGIYRFLTKRLGWTGRGLVRRVN